jgi:uncharacterized protein YndB with AHSA1/START domain
MSIAPIRKSVTVKAAPARAFTLFTRDIARWWEKGRTIGAKPHVDIVFEPRAGGRWYERDEDGAECDWGEVLAWEPPSRLLLGWRLNSRFEFDPNLLTEVELTFVAAKGGGTVVTLEHRNLERFGDAAQRVAEQIGSGWPRHLAEFAAYADAEETAPAK